MDFTRFGCSELSNYKIFQMIPGSSEDCEGANLGVAFFFERSAAAAAAVDPAAEAEPSGRAVDAQTHRHLLALRG